MTQKATVQIPRTLVNQLLHLAQQSPVEQIGGLIGQAEERCTCYPIALAESAEGKLFSLAADAQFAAVTTMQSQGQTLYAMYLSHPDAPALPPTFIDKTDAYPDILHLIISLNTRGVLEMRGFQLYQHQFEEVDLII